jgi:hypothetical protein
LDAYFAESHGQARSNSIVVFADDIDVYLATVRGASSALQAVLKKAATTSVKVLMTSLCPDSPADRSISAVMRATDVCISLGSKALVTDDANRQLTDLLALGPCSSAGRTRSALSLCMMETEGSHQGDVLMCSMTADMRRVAGRVFASF